MRIAILLLSCIAVVPAAVTTATIDYRDGAVALRGYAATPALATGATAPGVLVIHEWWGHNPYAQQRARELAEAGYVAFALDMYGAGKVTDDPKRAGELAGPFYGDRALLLARARAGLATLTGLPGVDPTKLGAIGFCFGGTVCLELARANEPLRGVVALHPGLKPVGGTPATGPITARVLVCTGGSDPFVPPADVATFMTEMVAAKATWDLQVYGTALHAFTNPKAKALHATMPAVDHDPVAEQAAMQATRAFLGAAFAAK